MARPERETTKDMIPIFRTLSLLALTLSSSALQQPPEDPLYFGPATGDGIVILTNGTNGTSVHQALEKAWIASLQAPAER